MTAEELRKVSGGVIGHFTPKEVEVDYTALAETGDKSIGLYVPAGKLIIGGYIKNEADDVASSGSATLRLKAVDYDGSNDQAFGDAAIGMVPSAAAIAGDNAEYYFLNAAGEWAIPVDARIGELKYKEQQYTTVEAYVEAYVADHGLVWEAI